MYSGNEALSWPQAGPEDFIFLNKYMLQGLSCSSYMIKLHPGMHSSMNPRNDVMNHGYKISSVTILRPDCILRDRDRKWKIQHCGRAQRQTKWNGSDRSSADRMNQILSDLNQLTCCWKNGHDRTGSHGGHGAPKNTSEFSF